MIAALLAAALAAPAPAQTAPGGKTYGVLILAYDVDAKWRRELGSLRGKLRGVPVESVESADDAISVQRAVDKLATQRVNKIVGVPIDAITESPRQDETRYLFGVRAEPASDLPGSGSGDLADKPTKALKPAAKSALVLPSDPGRRLGLAPGGSGAGLRPLKSPVPLSLAPALDKSPTFVAILADRAKALSPTPARETLVLAGVGPRNDAALQTWLIAAQAVADQVKAKAGFRKAVAVAVRDGVRADQQDKDRDALKATFRGLAREGRIAVVPLSPESDRVAELLHKALGGAYAYRWNGEGLRGDARLGDWIKASAAAAAALPDSRADGGARRAPGGRP